MLHIFSQPIEFYGKEVKQIELNLEQINAKKTFEVDRRFRQENPGFVGIAILENEYIIMLAQSVSDLPLEFFEQLSVAEMYSLTNAVRTFLQST